MNKKRYIYITTNLLNGVQYVGQRKLPANVEIEKDSYLGSGTILISAIKKHGRKNFKKEILEICYSQSEADRLEQFYFNKFKVLENKDKFYNRGLAGQKWREVGHSEFMSNTMKEYYKIESNRDKFYLSKFNMTEAEFKNKKELEHKEKEIKIYNKKIDRLNKRIQKAKYKFYRNLTQDLRQEFYNAKQEVIWSEKRKDQLFLNAVKQGKKSVDYKTLINKSKSKQSCGSVKNKSMIYNKIWEHNLSINQLKCKTLIKRYLDNKIKTADGLKQNVSNICKSLKNECNIEIEFNDLFREAKRKYLHLFPERFLQPINRMVS